MSKIEATIVADSVNQQGDRLTSLLITFPRILLSEINTHRMLSKNTSSSRAIPFKKMVEAIRENPFIPIAWQKEHKGMQGSEYFTDNNEGRIKSWLVARDVAVGQAKRLNDYYGVTKQLCNRLLEPFMWTTMLITGSKEGWSNFFELRCPQYLYDYEDEAIYFKSKKDWVNYYNESQGYKEGNKEFTKVENLSDLEWLQINKGQAEIHMMNLAEKIYDAMNESTPKQLEENEWHIPMIEDSNDSMPIEDKIKYSVGRAANTSYTVIGDGKKLTLEQAVRIHDKCKELNHSSVFEHCARAMSDEEYFSYHKGLVEGEFDSHTEIGSFFRILEEPKFMRDKRNGWCRNFKGFIQYRHIVENNLTQN